MKGAESQDNPQLDRRRRLVDRTGADILPVHWDDNYVTLLPGEQRVISATYEDAANRPGAPGVKIEGWNIKPKTLTVARKAVH